MSALICIVRSKGGWAGAGVAASYATASNLDVLTISKYCLFFAEL